MDSQDRKAEIELNDRTHRSALAASLLATTAFVLCSYPLQSQPAVAQTTTRNAAVRTFNIPAQPLAGALNAFGRQSGLQVTLAASTTRGISSRSVNGSFTPQQALAQMLEGTGIPFRITSDRTAVVGSAQVAGGGEALPVGAIPLDTIDVQGDLFRDSMLPTDPNRLVTTGTKTGTPLRDVPATVSVVPSGVLRDQGAMDLNYALQNSAGVQPLWGGGYGFANNYTVRGLAMRYLRDGYPDGPTQNSYYRTLYDVDRIEVLKGPGSALYGSGQPGGTINMVSKPPLSRFGAELGAFGGSYGTRGGYIDIGGPIGPQVNTRLIADYEKSDGFRGLKRDIKEVSPSLSWAYDVDKTLTLKYDHRDIYIVPDNYGIVFNNQGQLANVSREARYYSPFNYSHRLIDRVTAGHNWEIDPSLTMRTALIYDKRSLDFTRNVGNSGGNALNQMTGRTSRIHDDSERYFVAQNELIWKARTGPVDHTVLFGVEYSDTDIHTVRSQYALPNIANIDAPVVPEISLAGMALQPNNAFNRVLKQRNTGVYLQDQMAFGEHFKVRGALRADRVAFSDIGTQGTTFRAIDDTQNLTSGSLGAVWQPTRTLSFYAGIASSKFINVSTETTAVSLQPESGFQKEVGVKAEFLDGRLTTNISLFEARRENYLIRLPGALDPTPDGRDKNRGVEFEVSARPLPGWTILANFVLQKAEVESNTLASNANMGVINRSIAGTRPVGVAETAGRLWTTYDFQQGALQGWGVGLGVTYVGDTYVDTLNLYRLPSYVVVDAAIYYRQKNFDLTLNLRNLTDRTYHTPAWNGGLPGEGRSAMLTMRYRFE